MLEQGEVILVPVPFTDLSSQKRRPVIVLSSDDYNRRSADVIVVAMTSNPAPVPHSLLITSADLARGALNRPGTVRVDKITRWPNRSSPRDLPKRRLRLWIAFANCLVRSFALTE